MRVQLEENDECIIVEPREKHVKRNYVKDYTPYFNCPCCEKIVRISKHDSSEDTMNVYIPDSKVEKYVADMAAIADSSDDDTEDAHKNADDMLLVILEEIGLSKVVKEFKRCKKWYA